MLYASNSFSLICVSHCGGTGADVPRTPEVHLGVSRKVGRGTSRRAGRRANTEEQAEGNRHRGVGPRTG